MGCEGAFVTLQAVIVMQQFGLRRGPEVYSYTLSAQACAALLMSIFVHTLKPMGGFYLMFGISFCGLISASVCTFLINDRTKVKYGELYFENVGLVGSQRSQQSSMR